MKYAPQNNTKSAILYSIALWLLLPFMGIAQAETNVPPPISDPDTAIIQSYDIAPDGRRLTWLALYKGERRVFIRDLYGSDIVLLPPVAGMTEPRWSGDSRFVYVTSDPTGDENSHILVFDAEHPDKTPLDITPFPGKKAWLVDVNNVDGTALVAINLKTASVFDLYRIKPTGGAPQLIEDGHDSTTFWLTTSSGDLFGRMYEDASHKQIIDIGAPHSKKSTRFSMTGDFIGLGDFVGMVGNPLPDGSAWFMVRGAKDVSTLQRLDLTSGKILETIDNGGADASYALMDVNNKPLILETVPDYPLLRVFDPDLRKLLSGAPLPIHSFLKAVSYNRDFTRLIFHFETEWGEENLIYVDRLNHIVQILFHRAPFASQLPITVPISLTARDKLTLHGYLTYLPDRSPKNMPLVLLVHGGPWIRDNWGYDDQTVSIAMAGFAVLRVNYRGSGGYGRTFEQAGINEWGGKMQDDLTDSACWAIQQGIANPAKMIIAGGSYGGYAAVEALVKTPRLFAAAVDLDGPVDLPAMLDGLRPFVKSQRHRIEAYVGKDHASQWERSPLAHIDRIERPILGIQGVNDPRVNMSQLEKLETSLHAKGKQISVDYIIGEGHGISTQSNYISFMKKLISFLKDSTQDNQNSESDASYCR